MALIEIVNVSSPNDGEGDPLRVSQVKANNNAAELNDKKVEKVPGKDLSDNNFTDAEKDKLEGLAPDAQKNVQANWNQNDPTQDDYIIGKPDNARILTYGTYTLIGQDLTIFAGWYWEINGVTYTNTADIVINFPYASTGNQRLDRTVFNTSNSAERFEGEESETNPLVPPTTFDTVTFSISLITDSEVDEPDIPITSEDFVTKAEAGTRTTSDDGVVDFGSNFTRINLTEATELHYLAFDDNPYLYDGKPFFICNKNVDELDLTILNLSGSTFGRFSIPIGDLVLKYKEIAQFKLAVPSMILDYVGVIRKEISDIEGLEAELASKLDASAYNDRYKGKYTSLANLQSTHPTSNDGDYAIVDAGTGLPAQEYLWDSEEGWVPGTSVGATTTDALPEGSSNLYFTGARVLATLLTGISFATGGAIVSTDSVLVAFGKIQKQITDLISSVDLKAPLTTTYRETGTSFTLANSDNGTIISLTSSCTVTLPNGLSSGFSVTLVTLSGVTMTFSIGGSVTLFNNVGLTMTEKLSVTIQNRTATNQYIIAGGL